jgi:hypothetical protein
VDLDRRILATEGRFDSGIRRLQPERPVWAMSVVVFNLDSQYLLKGPRPIISSQSRHSARTVRIQRSA